MLAHARPVKVEQIPNEKEYSETHSFRYVAEVGEVLYIKVKNGMRSAGGYVLGRPSEHMLMVPEFPKELRVMQTGSLLAMSGERKVPSVSYTHLDVYKRRGTSLPAGGSARAWLGDDGCESASGNRGRTGRLDR